MCICIVVAVWAMCYRFLEYVPTTTDKKEGEQSRLLTAVVELPLQGKTKILACRQAFLSVTLVALYEIFHVSVRSEQIANAMS
jgi:hypothetical protein